MEHETDKTVFQSDRGPGEGWNNRFLRILIGVWPKTDRNVHHRSSVYSGFWGVVFEQDLGPEPLALDIPASKE